MDIINSVQPKNPNLIEITTPVQAKRGNRQFFDQHHKVSYITYANGYVRREIKATYVSPYTNSNKVYKCQDQFVINKRTYEKQSYTNCFGQLTTYTTTGVIKEPCPQKRMDIIDHHSTNYKGYKGRFTRSGCTLVAK